MLNAATPKNNDALKDNDLRFLWSLIDVATLKINGALKDNDLILARMLIQRC